MWCGAAPAASSTACGFVYLQNLIRHLKERQLECRRVGVVVSRGGVSVDDGGMWCRDTSLNTETPCHHLAHNLAC